MYAECRRSGEKTDDVAQQRRIVGSPLHFVIALR